MLVAIASARAQVLEPVRIVVSIPDRKLAVLEAGRVVRYFDVAVGADLSPTPAGTFTIVNRITTPTYYAPGVVIGPGKRNPLGTRWMGLSIKGFGIHGTNVPRSVGQAASHGCVRLRNADVEALFEIVSVGDIVELRAEPMSAAAAVLIAQAE
jgi:lipoprotein-anchoring transpeptidase ErfK/SrfK